MKDTNDNKQRKTFSRQVKDELRRILAGQPELAIWALTAFYQAVGVRRDKIICFDNMRLDNARSLQHVLTAFLHLPCQVTHHKESYSVQVRHEVIDKLQQPTLSDMARRQMLRVFFLLCGSISDPAVSYHLSFAFHRAEAATLAQTLLSDLDMRSKMIIQPDSWLVYIKESQHIADFLLHTGAHKSLLDFESLRVEKELRNNVNRVVNCDSANMQRIANTGTRQTALIRLIHQTAGLQSLPEDLYLTASLRLQHPDLSLKDLGELMEPPLGKSGVYHRLKKIEKISAEIIEKQAGHKKKKENH